MTMAIFLFSRLIHKIICLLLIQMANIFKKKEQLIWIFDCVRSYKKDKKKSQRRIKITHVYLKMDRTLFFFFKKVKKITHVYIKNKREQ